MIAVSLEMSDEPEYLQQFYNVIKEWNIDTIICLVYWDYVDFFSRQAKLKVFYHVHNVPHVEFCPTPSILPRCFLGTWIEKLAKRVDVRYRFFSSFRRIEKNEHKIVLLSDSFKNDINHIYKFKENTIVAIPNPVIKKRPIEGIPTKRHSIIYVGRLNDFHKRFQSVLNIWQKVQDRLPDYDLEIIGDSPERSRYEAKAKFMGLRNIQFHGFQKPDNYYSQASVLMLTSNYEGFGMVLVEAMQYGCVPFAFDTYTALHDIIDDGENGFIIPPFDEEKYADAIVRFVNSSEGVQNEIRMNAMNKTKKFSLGRISKEWIELFKGKCQKRF